jgi:hypothetical protein
VINLKREIERELSLIDPPDLWDRIRAGAATDDTLDLTIPRPRRRPSPWLAVAAAAVLIALVVAVTRSDSGQTVDTSPVDVPSLPDPLILPQYFEFAEAPTSGGAGVPPGGGLTLPAGGGLGGSTLDLTVTGEDGAVIGRARIDGFVDVPGNPPQDLTVELECFETDATDVIFGGEVITSSGGSPLVGEWIALLIRKGSSATVWWDSASSSCRELLGAVPHPRPDDRFVDVIESTDVETGQPTPDAP